MEIFLFISLVKYTLQSLEGQKRNDKKRKRIHGRMKDKIKKGGALRKSSFFLLRALDFDPY